MTLAMTPGHPDITTRHSSASHAGSAACLTIQPHAASARQFRFVLAHRVPEATVPLRTIFDSDLERRDETPAFPAEQKYDLAGACWTLG
jgi:hypothetical protein